MCLLKHRSVSLFVSVVVLNFLFRLPINSNKYYLPERKLLLRNDAPTAKPAISQPQRNGDLLSRLQTFLPQMEAANKNLEIDEAAAEARFEDPAYV